jgi:predicted small integral membrane protein
MSHNQYTEIQTQSRFSKFRTRMRTVPIKGNRRGFLPFNTNPFDRVFVGVVLTVAIHLLWMRFLEEDITLTVATILSLILSVLIFIKG